MTTKTERKWQIPGKWVTPLLGILLFLAPMLSFAEAGKIIFLIGDAEIISAEHGNLKAKTGMSFEAGDVLKTSNKGQMQVRMSDGGLIAVRPSSEFRIDEFVHNNDVSTDKSFFTLIKGGFRSVTGAIGEANKSSYKVDTPVATIGIRGTDYTARLCEADCSQDDGLYVSVLSGGVSLSNDAGVADVDPGEFGYVEDGVTDPVLLDAAPGDVLFAQSTSEGTSTDSSTSSTTETVTSSTVLAKTASNESGDSIDLNGVSSVNDVPVPVTDTSVADNTDTNTVVEDDTVVDTNPGDTQPVQKPQLRMIAMVGLGQSPILGTESADFVTYSADQNLDAFQITKSTDNVLSMTRDSSVSAIETGSTSDGSVSWGRWTAMNIAHTIDGASGNTTVDNTNSVHWILSDTFEDSIVFDTTATGTYKVVGGTNPTDNFNNVGSLDTAASTFSVNFADSKANFMAMVSMADAESDFNTGSNHWEMSYNGMTISNDGKFSGQISSMRTIDHPLYPTENTSTTSGMAQGSFAGGLSASGAPNAALISYTGSTSYDGFANTVALSIQGVAAAELQP